MFEVVGLGQLNIIHLRLRRGKSLGRSRLASALRPILKQSKWHQRVNSYSICPIPVTLQWEHEAQAHLARSCSLSMWEPTRLQCQ